jgi:hypothetical protein
LQLRPHIASAADWARRRSFIAEGAPLADGQVRFGDCTGRLAEEGRLDGAAKYHGGLKTAATKRVGGGAIEID